MLNHGTGLEEPRRGLLVEAARFASDLVWTSYGVVRLMIALHREQQDEQDDQDWWQARSARDDQDPRTPPYADGP